MEDMSRRRNVDAAVSRPGDVNGAHLRNMHGNAERLSKLKGFVVEKGPELLGDLFCPWAKWTLILLTTLIDTDDAGSLKIFAARIFGIASPDHPVKSPLQITVSAWRSISEKALGNAKCMADLRIGAVAICRAVILMLIMGIADFGWKQLTGFHVALYVAHTNLQFHAEAQGLIFQGLHVFLYTLHAVAPTVFSRFLLLMVGSVFAISIQSFNDLLLDVTLFPCVCVMFFYTPFWFGVCVLLATSAREFTRSQDLDSSTECAIVMGTCLCFVRLVVYASGGGFCGALFTVLCTLILPGCVDDAQEMATPLPLVCALISCLFTPLWVGLCFTSMLIFTLAAANDNVKAILWWFVSFAALHLLSYYFSRNFSVVAMCFMASYFSYGCIL